MPQHNQRLEDREQGDDCRKDGKGWKVGQAWGAEEPIITCKRLCQ
jgi:hypothetical protein